MKEVYDLTKSKRPQMEPDEGEVIQWETAREQIGERIERMDKLEDTLLLDKEYGKSVELSKKRTLQLLDELLEVEPSEDNLLVIAKFMGRIGERRTVTNELQGIRAHQGVLQRMANGFASKIKQWHRRNTTSETER